MFTGADAVATEYDAVVKTIDPIFRPYRKVFGHVRHCPTCACGQRLTLDSLLDHALPEPNTGCLIWLRAWSVTGYGHMVYEGRTWFAHRLAYTLAFGPIPSNLSVLHRCDMRACVNPTHLFLGTNDDNVADRCRKGRSSRLGNRGRLRPERSGHARLTWDLVREMRARYAQGGITQRQLAADYRCGHSTVGSVVSGHTWKEPT
jgi:hypothetical protein